MKNKDFNAELEEQYNKFMEMDEDEQAAKQAEITMQLIDLLPDPANAKEFAEFTALLENPPISGETDEELMISYLEMSKTHPKFFTQITALTALGADLDSLKNIASDMAKNNSSSQTVQAISKEELYAVKKEDEDAELEEFKKRLRAIPID